MIKRSGFRSLAGKSPVEYLYRRPMNDHDFWTQSAATGRSAIAKTIRDIASFGYKLVSKEKLDLSQFNSTNQPTRPLANM